ncbi:MAG: hypothetical protein ACFCU9_15660, partial [Cyanophyceae cyanobacterium]
IKNVSKSTQLLVQTDRIPAFRKNFGTRLDNILADRVDLVVVRSEEKRPSESKHGQTPEGLFS